MIYIQLCFKGDNPMQTRDSFSYSSLTAIYNKHQ